MPVPKSVVYKDFDIIFDRHPVTRKLNTLTNNDAVKRSLKNIILPRYMKSGVVKLIAIAWDNGMSA